MVPRLKCTSRPHRLNDLESEMKWRPLLSLRAWDAVPGQAAISSSIHADIDVLIWIQFSVRYLDSHIVAAHGMHCEARVKAWPC